MKFIALNRVFRVVTIIRASQHIHHLDLTAVVGSMENARAQGGRLTFLLYPVNMELLPHFPLVPFSTNQMQVLEKTGYLLHLSGWMGNLGNHMIQLTGAINVAEQTSSRLIVPEHPILKQRLFDFTSPGNDDCMEAVASPFFFHSDCFQHPIRYDSDRRRLLQEHVYRSLTRVGMGERLEHLFTRTRTERVDPDTLVINIRSGKDIFRADPPPQNDYMQPPLSFYKYVIDSHGYKDCLIVTESARRNPCIAALMEWNPDIRIKSHTTVRDDARTILSASHLVMCHSTFSWCLALMSKNLRVLHQPASFQIRGVSDFAVHTYEFNNYIRPGQWRAAREQLNLMTAHSTDDVSLLPHGTDASGALPESYLR